MTNGSKKMRRLIFSAATALVILIGCNAEDDWDRGHKDGYAAGLNTTCQYRSTLVHGEWDNKHYKRGYDVGYVSGEAECYRRKQQERD